jgi:hypothetical protein
MKSSVTKTFRKQLNNLPASVQEQAAKAYALWQEDPYHPSLQFKQVSQKQPIYSARGSSGFCVETRSILIEYPQNSPKSLAQ